MAIVHIERIPMFVKQEMIYPVDFLMENGIEEKTTFPQHGSAQILKKSIMVFLLMYMVL